MSLELIIARLVGAGENATEPVLSPAESRVLAQRLRAAVDGGDVPVPVGADPGPVAEAAQLAIYLEGAMAPAERAAFEQELVESPHRRDALLSAAAWLEHIAAMREEPSAAALDRAIALASQVQPAPVQRRGFAAFVDWLLPRPRLAIATTALATVAIAAVGLDLTLHLSPLMPGGSPPGVVSDADRPPVRTFLPINPKAAAGRVLLTTETVNAINAYLSQPGQQPLQELIACLTRAGAPALDAGRVRSVAVPSGFAGLIRQRPLPTAITVSLDADGTLRLQPAD